MSSCESMQDHASYWKYSVFFCSHWGALGPFIFFLVSRKWATLTWYIRYCTAFKPDVIQSSVISAALTFFNSCLDSTYSLSCCTTHHSSPTSKRPARSCMPSTRTCTIELNTICSSIIIISLKIEIMLLQCAAVV